MDARVKIQKRAENGRGAVMERPYPKGLEAQRVPFPCCSYFEFSA
jgi:hypothetical protein